MKIENFGNVHKVSMKKLLLNPFQHTLGIHLFQILTPEYLEQHIPIVRRLSYKKQSFVNFVS